VLQDAGARGDGLDIADAQARQGRRGRQQGDQGCLENVSAHLIGVFAVVDLLGDQAQPGAVQSWP
jgi:hypothetical protein